MKLPKSTFGIFFVPPIFFNPQVCRPDQTYLCLLPSRKSPRFIYTHFCDACPWTIVWGTPGVRNKWGKLKIFFFLSHRHSTAIMGGELGMCSIMFELSNVKRGEIKREEKHILDQVQGLACQACKCWLGWILRRIALFLSPLLKTEQNNVVDLVLTRVNWKAMGWGPSSEKTLVARQRLVFSSGKPLRTTMLRMGLLFTWFTPENHFSDTQVLNFLWPHCCWEPLRERAM